MNAAALKERLQNTIARFIEDYCAENSLTPIWRRPLVGFARASHPDIRRLRDLVVADHFLPEDFLPGANIVVSYFLPFTETMAAGNVSGRMASDAWAGAYLVTNRMAAKLNLRLVSFLEEMGGRAAAPEPGKIGVIGADKLFSRWSQRHLARLAGLGTFGLNNMLISESGCCGRYFSVVADLPIESDEPPAEENCLYKRNGSCRICAARCVAGALTAKGFDRDRCYSMCLENEASHPGAQVCGKCVVGLPCSFHRPA